jgi:hypothetical protein
VLHLRSGTLFEECKKEVVYPEGKDGRNSPFKNILCDIRTLQIFENDVVVDIIWAQHQNDVALKFIDITFVKTNEINVIYFLIRTRN